MYPDISALSIFLFVGAFSPGPNNLLASYSGFNFGIKKTLPLIYGVTFGFPVVLIAVNLGLAIVFNQFSLLQSVLKILGSGFLIYMAYKIAVSSKSEEKEIKIQLNFLTWSFFNLLIQKRF